MKTILKLLFAALALAALNLPAPAQEGGEADDSLRVSGEASPDDPAPEQKPAPKKKKKKTKKQEAPSEYKFKAAEETPTYKFDKNADPIVKPSKKKKKSGKSAGGGSGDSVPKLKKVKSFNEADAPAEGGQKLPDGVKLPPGVKIPGMGGN